MCLVDNKNRIRKKRSKSTHSIRCVLACWPIRSRFKRDALFKLLRLPPCSLILRLLIDFDCSILDLAFFLPLGLRCTTPFSRLICTFLYCWAVIDSFCGFLLPSSLWEAYCVFWAAQSNLISLAWGCSLLMMKCTWCSLCALPLFFSLSDMMLQWFSYSQSSVFSLFYIFASFYGPLDFDTIYRILPEKLGLLLLRRQSRVSAGLLPKVIFMGGASIFFYVWYCLVSSPPNVINLSEVAFFYDTGVCISWPYSSLSLAPCPLSPEHGL